MTIKEESIIMHRTDESGNKVMQFPYTKGENIETPVPVAAGGTGATTAANALKNLGLTATATELNYCDGVTSNIQTQLNNKVSSPYSDSATSIGGASVTTPAVVVTTYRSGTNWYRVWSDGWVEQGGVVTAKSGNQNNTENYAIVTLHKAYDDANYNLAFSLDIKQTATAIDTFVQVWTKSASNFNARLCDTGNVNSVTFTWYACGKGV